MKNPFKVGQYLPVNVLFVNLCNFFSEKKLQTGYLVRLDEKGNILMQIVALYFSDIPSFFIKFKVKVEPVKCEKRRRSN